MLKIQVRRRRLWRNFPERTPNGPRLIPTRGSKLASRGGRGLGPLRGLGRWWFCGLSCLSRPWPHKGATHKTNKDTGNRFKEREKRKEQTQAELRQQKAEDTDTRRKQRGRNKEGTEAPKKVFKLRKPLAHQTVKTNCGYKKCCCIVLFLFLLSKKGFDRWKKLFPF